MTNESTPRFVHVYRHASLGFSISDQDGPTDVYDSRHPGMDPGELVFFGTFPSRQAARLVCLSLNGATETESVQ